MRIAIVSDFFLDYVGGAQSSIFEQQASLVEAGHEVFLIAAGRQGGAVRELRGAGLEVRPSYVVPGVDLPVVPSRRPLITRLKKYFTEKRIDVIHLQTDFGLAHAATTAARELGLPVVHTVHTFYWQSSGAGPTLVAPLMKLTLENVTGVKFPRTVFTGRPSDDLLRNLTAAMASRADVVISPSAHQAADLQAAGVTAPVVVIPNPISRSHSPASELSPSAPPRFLWVARCQPEKRPLVFAAAVIEALASASFEVDFVGDGAELPELRKLVEGIPQVRVHGALDHGTVLDLIDAASMVVLTSNGFDNQPMTIAESVSRYRGVLFCDPKLREGLGNSGYLASSPEVHGLAQALVELSTTPGLLAKLSRGARLDAHTFSAAAFVERVTAVYEQAALAIR